MGVVWPSLWPQGFSAWPILARWPLAKRFGQAGVGAVAFSGGASTQPPKLEVTLPGHPAVRIRRQGGYGWHNLAPWQARRLLDLGGGFSILIACHNYGG